MELLRPPSTQRVSPCGRAGGRTDWEGTGLRAGQAGAERIEPRREGARGRRRVRTSFKKSAAALVGLAWGWGGGEGVAREGPRQLATSCSRGGKGWTGPCYGDVGRAQKLLQAGDSDPLRSADSTAALLPLRFDPHCSSLLLPSSRHGHSSPSSSSRIPPRPSN